MIEIAPEPNPTTGPPVPTIAGSVAGGIALFILVAVGVLVLIMIVLVYRHRRPDQPHNGYVPLDGDSKELILNMYEHIILTL